MTTGRLILVLVLIGAIQAQEESSFYPVKVSVFYSVMCNNCRAFFTAKFAPQYDDFKQWIDLDLVPFGNSTHEEGDGFTFSCPEGPDECVANKWHACANAIYRGSKPQQLALFVNCTLWQDDHFFEALNTCADDHFLDFLPIQHCVNGFDGSVHLAANAARTSQHDPQITSFPTIEFNGTYDEALHALAVKDFKAALCSQIKDPATGATPQACKSAAPHLLPLLALLLSAIALEKLFS